MVREGSSPSVPTSLRTRRNPPTPTSTLPLSAQTGSVDQVDAGRAGTTSAGGRWALPGLMLLALLPRLLIVLAPQVDLSVHGEEYQRANVAWELLNDPALSLIDYQYAPFFGGSLVTSVLAAPLFALFGVQMWVLKLVPALTHVIAVGLLFCILRRWVSRRAAWVGGLLFAWGSPGYTYLTTIAWGSHVESNALALLCLALWLGVHGQSAQPGRRFFLGVAGGFALYFGLQCALVLLAILIVDGLRDWTVFRRREFGSQVLGFALGFSPWLAYNLQNSFSGTRLYDRTLVEHVEAQAASVTRFVQLALEGFPESMSFAGLGPLSGQALGGLVYALLLAVFGVGVWRARNWRSTNPGVLAAVYCALFLGAYSLSDFPIPSAESRIYDYRYVALVWPWAVILIAIGADHLLSVLPGLKATGRGIFALILALSWFGSATSFADLRRFGDDFDRSAIALRGHGKWYAWRCCSQPRLQAPVLAALQARPDDVRREIYDGMGRFLRDMTRYKDSGLDVAYSRSEDALEFFRQGVQDKYRQLFRPRPLRNQ